MAPRIFVSIACYCDPDCGPTIADALAKATHPDRLRFGVCFQQDLDEPDHLADWDGHPQVRLVRMAHTDARGPTFARYRCARLLADEPYYLQIDSHTRFFPGWDERLLADLEVCPPRSVLSTFPIAIVHMHKPERQAQLGHSGFVREISRERVKIGSAYKRLTTRPRPSLSISAAFLFGPSAFLRAVPLDPRLPYGLQFVEQVFYALRLWTSGWDMFTPTRHSVATHYRKTTRRPYNHDHPRATALRAESGRKVRALLGMEPRASILPELAVDLDRYNLGDARSLDDYFVNAGVCTWEQAKARVARGEVYRHKQGWVREFDAD